MTGYTNVRFGAGDVVILNRAGNMEPNSAVRRHASIAPTAEC